MRIPLRRNYNDENAPEIQEDTAQEELVHFEEASRPDDQVRNSHSGSRLHRLSHRLRLSLPKHIKITTLFFKSQHDGHDTEKNGATDVKKMRIRKNKGTAMVNFVVVNGHEIPPMTNGRDSSEQYIQQQHHQSLTTRFKNTLKRTFSSRKHYKSSSSDGKSSLLLSSAASVIASSSTKHTKTKSKKKNDSPAVIVEDVHSLRRQVLQNHVLLKDIEFNFTRPVVNATTVTTDQLMNHSVIQLIAQRVRTNSTPGNRADNDQEAHLALAIEGGGMRGAVSAGMAAAIASLGLTDAFDSVYGSSAGCIVGAYMVSRQMCVDVYTEVLPAAGSMFASKGRVIGNAGVGYVSDLVARLREQGETTLAAAVAATVRSTNNASVPVEFIRIDDDLTADNNNIIPPPPIGAEQRTVKTVGLSNKIIDKLPALKKVPSALSSLRPYLTLNPGMNLTFVIEGIMSSTSGLRPFDIETFRKNDAKQPLRAISSTVRGGKMETVAFGSKVGDYWDSWIEEYEEGPEIRTESRLKRTRKLVQRILISLVDILMKSVRKTKNAGRRLLGRKIVVPPPEAELVANDEVKNSITSYFRRQAIRHPQKVKQLQRATACPDNTGKKGLFACLESSMLVPGAAGPPLKLLRGKHRKEAEQGGNANNTNICFDAFAYEPIPYRSAVENGATHVLALRSRPDGCSPETKPSTYEKLVAPVYFRLNGLPLVANYFLKGGSQYRYLEDVLTLDEGLAVGCNPDSPFEKVKVPPTEILYGTEDDSRFQVDPDAWPTAHLLPVVCKAGTPELPSLAQEKAEVVCAVRDGFVAAFDMLAPIAGLNIDPKLLDSRKIAEMMFPIREDEDVDVLGNPVQIQGYVIEGYEPDQERKRIRFARWINRKRQERSLWLEKARRSPFRAAEIEAEIENPGMVGGRKDKLDWLEAEALIAALPGFRSGKLPHLADHLRSYSTRLVNDSSLSTTDDEKDREVYT